MSLTEHLRRAGGASPVLPPAVYAAGLSLASVARGLAPGSATIAIVAFLVWAASLATFVVVVTWYRTDDWLGAGFLLGIGFLVADVLAGALTSIATTHSIAAATFAAGVAVFGVLLRAVILVPVCGGLVAGMRWMTGLFRSPSAPTPPA